MRLDSTTGCSLSSLVDLHKQLLAAVWRVHFLSQSDARVRGEDKD